LFKVAISVMAEGPVLRHPSEAHLFHPKWNMAGASKLKSCLQWEILPKMNKP